jgi:F-type H+-transporting ATPase subunit delta
MSANPLTAKIAAPYARALFDISIEKNIMHQITMDFQNLKIFLKENSELTDCLNSPIISQDAKYEILGEILESQIHVETFRFLTVLIKRNRINLLEIIMISYLELICEIASLKTIEVSTAFAFTNLQKNTLVNKLKKLTNAREIRLTLKLDPSLIGGFLIKTESKIIDFTVKNQLEKLAKHLDTVLEI